MIKDTQLIFRCSIINQLFQVQLEVFKKLKKFKKLLCNQLIYMKGQRNLYIELLGVEHISSLTAMINFAKTLRKNNEITQAIKLLQDIISILFSQKDTKLIIQAQQNLAACFKETNQFEDAINIYEKLLQTDGLKSNIKSHILNDFALLEKNQKNYEKAEKLYKESLQLREQESNRNISELIASYHNLGELYVSKNDKHEAQVWFNKAIELMKERENKLQQKEEETPWQKEN